MSDQTMAVIREWLGVILQVLLIVAPIVLFRYVRAFVNQSTAQPRIAAITQLAGAAIDYAENLEKRGDLPETDGLSRGRQKLDVASAWLAEELGKTGITFTHTQAQKWIAAAFQSRVGSDAGRANKLEEIARSAVDIIQALARKDVITVPPDIDRFSYLAGLGADWVVTQMAQAGMQVSRDEAFIWVRATLFNSLQSADLAGGEPLSELARQALSFVNDLKAKGQLVVRPGTNPRDTEFDLATAWVMTEAARLGMQINPEIIIQAVANAMQAGSSPQTQVVRQ